MDQTTKMEKNKTYIGDGVYISFDGYQIWLETERVRNLRSGSVEVCWEKIALEPEVFSKLLEYAKQVGWKALI